jgi:hypothetical protein
MEQYVFRRQEHQERGSLMKRHLLLGIDDTIFPQRYYFDYVRVYTRDKKAADAAPQPSGPAAAS